MNDFKQLWTFADIDCQIPTYGNNKKSVNMRSCKNAPMMSWPDGSICWAVSSWLLLKYKSKPYKSTRGGSSGTYASLLSHLVRFVFDRRISFTNLRDENLYEWAESLQNHKDKKTGLFRRRSNTQIGRIMRRGIDFLRWYQDTYLFNQIIVGTSSEGAQIKVTTKEGRSGKFRFSYIDHDAIPKNDVPEAVKPISHSVITQLYDAIPASTNNTFIRKRRQQLLLLLEATGGRRLEVSGIRVIDIANALKTGRLRVRSAKKQQDEFREIPVAREWLDPVKLFINTHRKHLVHKLITSNKLSEDHDYLFLSETTGNPLNEETITSEISELRRISGIDEKACAHMFRHRFITLQVIYRLKNYSGHGLNMRSLHLLLTKVSSITGHKRIESLMPYVDLAFQEIGVWDTAEKVLNMRSKSEAAFRQIQTLKQDIVDGTLKGQNLLDQVTDILGAVISGLQDIQASDQTYLNY